ncbi:hypothetical protein FACS189445_1130 [Spirochaetia bacterium]|nr:hypothetical protein FACS189445_1130 [Spirochaetia bacterium]
MLKIDAIHLIADPRKTGFEKTRSTEAAVDWAMGTGACLVFGWSPFPWYVISGTIVHENHQCENRGALW